MDKNDIYKEGAIILNEYTAKYLRITMHDNDFWLSLEYLSKMLYDIFISERRFPEEDELPLLKKIYTTIMVFVA